MSEVKNKYFRKEYREVCGGEKTFKWVCADDDYEKLEAENKDLKEAIDWNKCGGIDSDGQAYLTRMQADTADKLEVIFKLQAENERLKEHNELMISSLELLLTGSENFLDMKIMRHAIKAPRPIKDEL